MNKEAIIERACALSDRVWQHLDPQSHTRMILVSELIDSPEKWTRQTYFRNENGKSCHKQDAVQYSLSGALHILRWRLCLFYYGIIYELLVLEIMHSWPERFNPDLPIFSFNDHPDTTYDDVMKLCERIGV